MDGYPSIIGWPWLSIADAYIACQSTSMAISNGIYTKNLNLYSPSQQLLLDDQIICPNLGDDDNCPNLGELDFIHVCTCWLQSDYNDYNENDDSKVHLGHVHIPFQRGD